MKKLRLTSIVFLMVLLTAGLVGCGSEPSASNSGDSAKKESTDKEKTPKETGNEGYQFESGGVKIGVDMDVEPIKEALGEPKSVFEEPSCAAQGTAYLYTYSGFEINTYPDGDVNKIAYILLKDDTVSTPEGVNLSQTKEDVIAAYGEDYTEENNKITYKKGDMTLNFLFEEDSIKSIEYDSGVLN